MESHPQHELTPGQQVLSTIPIGGPERTYTMTSTDKHKVSRGEFPYVVVAIGGDISSPLGTDNGFLSMSCAGRYLTSNDKRGYM